jgi:D-alanyl-D-alanine carboxypeptidase
LLSQANTEALTRGKVDYGARRYAYGFSEETTNGHRLIGHSGGSTGIANELMIFTDLGYTVVILTNGDVENFWDVQTFVKRELMGPSPTTDTYYFTKKLIDSTATEGYEAGVAMLKNAPSSMVPRSGLLEQVGYKLLWQGKTNQALNVFRIYAHVSPNDPYAHLGLGKTFERSGDKARAIQAYRTYLTIEPDDAEVKARLKRLQG